MSFSTPSTLSIFTGNAANQGLQIQNFKKFVPEARRFIIGNAFEIAQHEAAVFGSDIRFRFGTFNVLFMHLKLQELGFREKCEPPEVDTVLNLVGFFKGQEHDYEVFPNDYNHEPTEHGGLADEGVGQLSSLRTEIKVSHAPAAPTQKSKASNKGKKGKKVPAPKSPAHGNSAIQARLRRTYDQRQAAMNPEQDKAEKMKAVLDAVNQDRAGLAEEDDAEEEIPDHETDREDPAMIPLYAKKSVVEKLATNNVGIDVTSTQREYWTEAFVDLFPDMGHCERGARVMAMESREVTKDNKNPFDVKWNSYIYVRDVLNCKLTSPIWMPVLLGLSKGCELYMDIIEELKGAMSVVAEPSSSVATPTIPTTTTTVATPTSTTRTIATPTSTTRTIATPISRMKSVATPTTPTTKGAAVPATPKSSAHRTSVLQQPLSAWDASAANPFNYLKDGVITPQDTFLKKQVTKTPDRQYTFGKSMRQSPATIKSHTVRPFTQDTFEFRTPLQTATPEFTPVKLSHSIVFGDASKEPYRPITNNIFARAALNRPGLGPFSFASGQPDDHAAQAPLAVADAGNSSAPAAKPTESPLESATKAQPVDDVPERLLTWFQERQTKVLEAPSTTPLPLPSEDEELALTRDPEDLDIATAPTDEDVADQEEDFDEDMFIEEANSLCSEPPDGQREDDSGDSQLNLPEHNQDTLGTDGEPTSSEDGLLEADVASNNTRETSPTPEPVDYGMGFIGGNFLEKYCLLGMDQSDEQDSVQVSDASLDESIDKLPQLEISTSIAPSTIGTPNDSPGDDVDMAALVSTLNVDDLFNNDHEGDAENFLGLRLEPLEDLEGWAKNAFDNAFGSSSAPPQHPALELDQTAFHELFDQEPLFSDQGLHTSTSAADGFSEDGGRLLERLEHSSFADIIANMKGDVPAQKEAASIVDGQHIKPKAPQHLALSTITTIAVDPKFGWLDTNNASRPGKDAPCSVLPPEHVSSTKPKLDVATPPPLATQFPNVHTMFSEALNTKLSLPPRPRNLF